MFSSIVLSLDPSLGKIDKSSLSQETLMELLVESITLREAICVSDNVKEWEGIRTNTSQEITSIRWTGLQLMGTIDLKWLPESVQSFNIEENEMSSLTPDTA